MGIALQEEGRGGGGGGGEHIDPHLHVSSS